MPACLRPPPLPRALAQARDVVQSLPPELRGRVNDKEVSESPSEVPGRVTDAEVSESPSEVTGRVTDAEVVPHSPRLHASGVITHGSPLGPPHAT